MRANSRPWRRKGELGGGADALGYVLLLVRGNEGERTRRAEAAKRSRAGGQVGRMVEGGMQIAPGRRGRGGKGCRSSGQHSKSS